MSEMAKTKKRRFQLNNNQELESEIRNGSSDKKKEKDSRQLSND
jgi:hypothetical protein